MNAHDDILHEYYLNQPILYKYKYIQCRKDYEQSLLELKKKYGVDRKVGRSVFYGICSQITIIFLISYGKYDIMHMYFEMEMFIELRHLNHMKPPTN